MAPPLPSVLDADALPLAELCAARLDGELLSSAGRYLAIDAPDAAEVRAALLRAGRNERMIVELRSAAWVHGALDQPPAQPQFCVSTDARTHRRPLGGLREVRFDPGDLVAFGGVLVTAPLRTVLDLVRTADDAQHRGDADALRSLLGLAGVSAEEAARRLDERRKLPGKAVAIARLLALAQPAETR